MKITVQDFQSLGNVALDANGLTVIVGRSNLGKSALVRAITAALFNRPGEDCVRLGKQVTTVRLDGLPNMQGGLVTIEWRKGHNVNSFKVNGEEFRKVGVAAPPAIAEAGYRDVFIGDKERNKGEDIRPQVAEQFDAPFLLKKPGSFVSDVLSVVSRLGVLLNANGRCARDLKSQKQMLGVRRNDLDEARKKLDALKPVEELHTRVAALGAALS